MHAGETKQTRVNTTQDGTTHTFEELQSLQRPGAKIIKKFGAWIGAQLKILCSKFRKLRSGDYKEIGVRFLCSV